MSEWLVTTKQKSINFSWVYFWQGDFSLSIYQLFVYWFFFTHCRRPVPRQRRDSHRSQSPSHQILTPRELAGGCRPWGSWACWSLFGCRLACSFQWLIQFSLAWQNVRRWSDWTQSLGFRVVKLSQGSPFRCWIVPLSLSRFLGRLWLVQGSWSDC